MKPLLLTVLALTAQDAGRAGEFFDRIEFEAVRPEADEERKALEILNRREHWIGAFRTIEAKCGPFPDALALKVDFSLAGGEAGWGVGRGSEGRIRFNLKLLGDIQRKTDEIEVRRKESQARGGKVVTKVPPARIERVLYHELTHVLQREYSAPDWFNEGMAQYVADDPNNLCGFALTGKKVEEIEAAASDPHDVYARGHLFWKWLDSRNAVRKVVDRTVFQRKGWKESLEEATGFPWTVLVIAERDWSAEEIRKYRAK